MFTIIGGDGKEYGPVSADQVRAWLAAGRASLDTKARVVGTEEWRRLADFVEFNPPSDAPPPIMTPAPVASAAAGSTVAVVADAPLASRLTRLGAAIIDRLLSSLCALPGLIIMGPAFAQLVVAAMRGEQPDLEQFDVTSVVLGGFVAAIGMLGLLIVQVWMLSTRGQSIGKRLLGIRIVMFQDNRNPGFMHAWLLRNFVPGVIGIMPYIGLLFVIVDLCFIFGEPRRCVHDLIAGTKVVKA